MISDIEDLEVMKSPKITQRNTEIDCKFCGAVLSKMTGKQVLTFVVEEQGLPYCDLL
jgi:hypothetical protein